jgi:hypothetical protein
MDLVLNYDPATLEATDVIKGSVISDSIFDYSIQKGTVRISLANDDGFSGNGPVAYLRFNVIGPDGSSSALTIAENMANKADYEIIQLDHQDGVFRVIGEEEAKGDWDGDGDLTVLDALSALQMAVDKRPEDLALDINNDGRVTSLDARNILKIAVGLN